MAFRNRGKKDKKSRRIFKNEEIKAFTILVVEEDGTQVGTMPRAKALALAGQKGLDLVQISYDPEKRICTAKMVDFGRYQYQKKKDENEKRKKQKAKVQKEVKFGYNIGDHDLEMKVNKAIEFLQKGHPVKINVVLRGRERVYKDIVRVKLDGVEEQLKEHGKPMGVKQEAHGFSLVILANKTASSKNKKGGSNGKAKKKNKPDGVKKDSGLNKKETKGDEKSNTSSTVKKATKKTSSKKVDTTEKKSKSITSAKNVAAEKTPTKKEV